jgi:predicted peptidase
MVRWSRLRRTVAVIAVLLGAGCRSGPGPALDSPGVSAAPGPGIHQQSIGGPGGQELRFTVSVPPGYDGVRPVPLVLALHFGGRAFPPYYGRNILEVLVQPALESLGALIVAPDALDSNWGDAIDEARVLSLLDHLASTFAIDRKRVLCTGYSMGGAGTWYFVGRHPGRFTAAIPIAGRPPTGDGAPTSPPKVPIYAIHSRADEVVPLADTEAHVAALRAQGADVQLTIIDGVTHFQTDRFVEPLRDALPWLARVWK